MDNQEIAGILEEYAELLELNGEDVFRVNAYRRAAKSLRNLNTDVVELWRSKRLKEVPGVGRALSLIHI